ncbi:AAA family ATPase [Azospirillum sp. ST 5-10]|uniref:AAA family ATPase n=1 Tax=unclassified Azospirillum TaxID=2630922 RepID=UPI003F4A2545
MRDVAGHILILTGPPGAGKTTTALGLARSSAVAAVHLHGDDFWHFIRQGAIPPYLPEAHEQNRCVMAVLARASQGYAEGGYFVVVDGIVGPWFLDPFRTLTRPVHYVILRPDLEAAIDRCRRRGGDTLADPVPITALHRQFSSLGAFERNVIDTAGHGTQDTLTAVREALHSDEYRLG